MNAITTYVKKMTPKQKMLAIFLLTVVAPPLLDIVTGCYYYSRTAHDAIFGDFPWVWRCGFTIGILSNTPPVLGSLWVMAMNRWTKTDSWVWYVLPLLPLVGFGYLVVLAIMLSGGIVLVR